MQLAPECEHLFVLGIGAILRETPQDYIAELRILISCTFDNRNKRLYCLPELRANFSNYLGKIFLQIPLCKSFSSTIFIKNSLS